MTVEKRARDIYLSNLASIVQYDPIHFEESLKSHGYGPEFQ